MSQQAKNEAFSRFNAVVSDRKSSPIVFVASHYRAKQRALKVQKERQREKRAYDKAKRDLTRESIELLE